MPNVIEFDDKEAEDLAAEWFVEDQDEHGDQGAVHQVDPDEIEVVYDDAPVEIIRRWIEDRFAVDYEDDADYEDEILDPDSLPGYAVEAFAGDHDLPTPYAGGQPDTDHDGVPDRVPTRSGPAFDLHDRHRPAHQRAQRRRAAGLARKASRRSRCHVAHRLQQAPSGAGIAFMALWNFYTVAAVGDDIKAIKGGSSGNVTHSRDAQHASRMTRLKITGFLTGLAALIGLIIWWNWFDKWWPTKWEAAAIAAVAAIPVAYVLGTIGHLVNRTDEPVEDFADLDVTVDGGSIRDAVIAADVPAINKWIKTAENPGEVIRFQAGTPRAALTGAGTEATFQLRVGNVGDLTRRRDKMAASMGIGTEQLLVNRSPRARREDVVDVFIADHPLDETDPGRWPLLDLDRPLDLWSDPIPWAVDARGQVVTLTDICDRSMVVIATTRAGKSNLILGLGSAVACDPLARLTLIDGKASGTYNALARAAADIYVQGEDLPTLRQVVQLLRHLKLRIEARQAIIRRFRNEEAERLGRVAEGVKLDAHVSAHTGLGVSITIFDEAHLFLRKKTSSDDANKLLKEARELAEDIARTGASVGEVLWIISQKGDDGNFPKGLTQNAQIAIAGRVADADTTELILSKEAIKLGYKPHLYSLEPKHRGVFAIKGEAGGIIEGRAYLVDNDRQLLQQVIDRARRWRMEAGTVAGYAAGALEENEVPTDTSGKAPKAKTRIVVDSSAPTLEHLAAIIGDRRGAPLGEIGRELAAMWPDRYEIPDGQTPGRYAGAIIREAVGTDVDLNRKVSGQKALMAETVAAALTAGDPIDLDDQSDDQADDEDEHEDEEAEISYPAWMGLGDGVIEDDDETPQRRPTLRLVTTGEDLDVDDGTVIEDIDPGHDAGRDGDIDAGHDDWDDSEFDGWDLDDDALDDEVDDDAPDRDTDEAFDEDISGLDDDEFFDPEEED